MKGNHSPRTYGTKLLEPRGNQAKVESPVTSRICDVEHYERTGELKYIDEEETVMPKVDGVENARRMREDLTTLELFEAVGTYSDVAKKYLTSKTTAHGHLMHLKSLAGQGPKTDEVVPSLEEIETFHTDVEPPQELPRVEFDKSCNLPSETETDSPSELQPQTMDCAKEGIQTDCEPNIDEQTECLSGESCAKCKEVLSVTFCQECGDLLIPPRNLFLCDECKAAQESKGVIESNEALDEAVSELESSWAKPELTIEELWKSIELDIAALHKLHIEQAENDFQSRIKAVIEAC